jgi:hypothetical protein
MGIDGSLVKAWQIQLPDISKIQVKFDAFYIGIDFRSKSDCGASTAWGEGPSILGFFYERALGLPVPLNINNSACPSGSSIYRDAVWNGCPFGLSKIANLPDFYYVNKRSSPDNNQAFYFVQTIGNNRNIGNFALFQLTDIIDNDNLESINWIDFLIGSQIAGMPDAIHVTITKQIYEVALICQKTFNVTNNIYAIFGGRIFNDTWQGRKTPTTIMTNPVDIFEHICRLQDGSENDFINPSSTVGWGQVYWKNALIKTSGDGSFDDTSDANFVALKSMLASGQIFDRKKAFTNDIKRKLCYQFGMANWIDAMGNECIKSIRKALLSPSDLITIYNILDRGSIKVTFPDPKDIYPEPFVRFSYNPGSDLYDNFIQVTNINYENPTPAQMLSFVMGCESQSAAVYIYTQCQGLMQRTYTVEPPPSDMTDLDFVYDYDTAVQHLIDWIDWMYNPEIEFKVSASLVDTWVECHRFMIQLPHQTGNVQIECLLEEITINPNNEHEAMIKAIMFSDSIPSGFSFQDSLNLIGQLWQDSLNNTNPLKQENF